MSLSTTYANINSLGDISFVAGNTYTLKFIFLDQGGTAIDLSSATVRWRMAAYGTNYVQVNKTASIVATNEADVLLTTGDTAGLSGKFIHQPEIQFSSGSVLRPAQGIITLVQGLV